MIEERDASATVIVTYVYGPYIDEPVSYQLGSDPGVNYYVHADEQYNAVAVTNASGAVVERYDYGDYGQPFIYDGAGSSITATAVGNVYLFTGRRYDAEIGWYHYRTRYLDPLTGRFTTRDTIGIWGDPINLGNGYTYVGNRPWSLLDPFGLEELYNVARAIEYYVQDAPSCLDCHNPWVNGYFGHTLPFPDQATRDTLEMRLAGWGTTITGAQTATPRMFLTGTGGVGNTWLDRNTDTIVLVADVVGTAADIATIPGKRQLIKGGIKFLMNPRRTLRGLRAGLDDAAEWAGKALDGDDVAKLFGAGDEVCETGAKYADDVGATAARGGESEAAARGRAVHEEFAEQVKAKPGWDPRPRLQGKDGRTLIPDALDPKGRPVELKPNTPSGRAQGARQIQKYKDATGTNGRVIYYDP